VTRIVLGRRCIGSGSALRRVAPLSSLAIGLVLALAAPLGPPAPAIAQSDAAAEARAPLPASGRPAPPPIDATSLGVPSPVSAVLVEVATGQVLVAHDADVQRPIASAMKLVTALAALEALPGGSSVAIGEEVVGIEGSSYGLRPGEVRSIEDLLVGLLLRSGNDVAVALAVAIDGSEEAFLVRMAGVLADLGIEAQPATASGLEPGDALTATELAVVARAALAEDRIKSLVAAPVLVLSDGASVENRNLFLLDVVGATGLKTGFTSAAGYTLAASATRDGRELVAVVLGAADDRARRDFAARLIEYGYSATAPITLQRSVTLRTASGPVRLATTDTVMTVASTDEIEVDWPLTLRPDDAPATVDVRVRAAAAGRAGVVRLDGRRSADVPSLGRALADGAYGALRPYGLANGLR